MKILYLSDSYAENVCGTKCSIFKEMQSRNFSIKWKNVHSLEKNIIDGSELLNTIKKEKFTDVWIAHTWSQYSGCTLHDINNLGSRVLGFGFSDPYEWDENKLLNYNIYVTNCYNTFLHTREKIKTFYFPTACDTSFHRKINLEKTTDIIVYGQGFHSRFTPATYRINTMNHILKKFPSYKIKIFGTNWKNIRSYGQLEGQEFIKEINSAKISLDLQQENSPLAHRMFECMACGTPVITKDRKEARDILGVNSDIIFYNDLSDLLVKIDHLLKDNLLREKIGKNMYDITRKMHNISNRVATLLEFLEMI
jgi:hypothetical protein